MLTLTSCPWKWSQAKAVPLWKIPCSQVAASSCFLSTWLLAGCSGGHVSWRVSFHTCLVQRLLHVVGKANLQQKVTDTAVSSQQQLRYHSSKSQA